MDDRKFSKPKIRGTWCSKSLNILSERFEQHEIEEWLRLRLHPMGNPGLITTWPCGDNVSLLPYLELMEDIE